MDSNFGCGFTDNDSFSVGSDRCSYLQTWQYVG